MAPRFMGSGVKYHNIYQVGIATACAAVLIAVLVFSIAIISRPLDRRNVLDPDDPPGLV